jgi:hypothetical protein
VSNLPNRSDRLFLEHAETLSEEKEAYELVAEEPGSKTLTLGELTHFFDQSHR